MIQATSRAAYASVEDFVGPLRALVFEAIARSGPIMDEQLCAVTGLVPNTCRPRRVELATLGFIRKAGRGVTRSGRSADRWEVVPR